MSFIISCPFFSPRKLVNLLESFKKTGLVAEKGDPKAQQSEEKSAPSAGGSAITYELYYAPEHARLNQLARVANLEKKIDHVEGLLGNNPDKLVSLVKFVLVFIAVCFHVLCVFVFSSLQMEIMSLCFIIRL